MEWWSGGVVGCAYSTTQSLHYPTTSSPPAVRRPHPTRVAEVVLVFLGRLRLRREGLRVISPTHLFRRPQLARHVTGFESGGTASTKHQHRYEKRCTGSIDY